MNLKTGRRKGNKLARQARERINQLPLIGRFGSMTGRNSNARPESSAEERDRSATSAW